MSRHKKRKDAKGQTRMRREREKTNKKGGGGKSTISSGWVGNGYIKPRHQYLGTDSASEELLAESSFRSETLSKRTQPGKNRNEPKNKKTKQNKKQRERTRSKTIHQRSIGTHLFYRNTPSVTELYNQRLYFFPFFEYVRK